MGGGGCQESSLAKLNPEVPKKTGILQGGLHGPRPPLAWPRNTFRLLGGLPGCLQGLTSHRAGHHRDTAWPSRHLGGHARSLPGVGWAWSHLCHHLPPPPPGGLQAQAWLGVTTG